MHFTVDLRKYFKSVDPDSFEYFYIYRTPALYDLNYICDDLAHLLNDHPRLKHEFIREQSVNPIHILTQELIDLYGIQNLKTQQPGVTPNSKQANTVFMQMNFKSAFYKVIKVVEQ
jgi:hypothetical protein